MIECAKSPGLTVGRVAKKDTRCVCQLVVGFSFDTAATAFSASSVLFRIRRAELTGIAACLKSMRALLNPLIVASTILLLSALLAQGATPKLALFNMTTRSDFPGVYLAQPGTDRWGENQALNDKDKSLDNEERLVLKGIAPGHFDLKLVDRQGRTCIIRNIDLATESSYEIRDEALTDCK